MSTTDVPAASMAAQVRLNRVTPSYCRVVLDNPPLNLMGPDFVPQIRDIVTALENDDRVMVVVFESAVDGFFLNHSDFLANFEDLTSIPQGPTGLELAVAHDRALQAFKYPFAYAASIGVDYAATTLAVAPPATAAEAPN
jgi:enoyl-CoA hydratase/carnithine racemase